MEEFNVVALGPSLSGKTLFLASLYETIQVPDALRGLTFGTSTTEGNRLRGIYDQVADPAASWPASQEPHEWHDVVFTCTVRSKYSSHQLFQIRYADYDGSHLTRSEKGSEVVARLEERIRAAHALLILIDGRPLLDYLEGRESGRDFFRQQLQPMFDAINSCAGPIQFIITKWDLLDEKYKLAEVRDRLLTAPEFPGFAALASSSSKQRYWEGRPLGVVRLIPVSATGDYAVLNASGRMAKDATRRPAPWNVEVPLVAIIPDVCRWVLDVLADAEDVRQPSGGGIHPGSGDFPPSSGNVTFGPFGVTIAVDTVAKVAARLRRPASTALRRLVRLARRQYRKRRVRELDRVRNDESALYYAIGVFTERLADFERAYPDSRLDPLDDHPSAKRLG